MILERLTDRAKLVILSVTENAKDKPAKKSPNVVVVSSLLNNILEAGGVGSTILKNNPGIQFDPKLQIDLNELVEKAFYLSQSLKHLYVGTEHLLVALLDLAHSPDLESVKKQLQKMSLFPSSQNVTDLGLDPVSPFMEAFCVNLNKKVAQSGDLTLIHRKELQSLIAILLKKENPNAILVGESGVGRRTLIDLLAQRINSLNIPSALAGYQVIEFDVMAFIASISARDGFDTAITALLEEFDKQGDVILYIKDFQNVFVGTNVGLAVPFVFSMLKSYLASSGISIIGVFSSDFYSRLENENPAFLDGFETVKVEEPSEEETLRILRAKVNSLSLFHNIDISDSLLKYTMIKAQNSIKGTNSPQNAISLLDHACAMLLIKKDIIPGTYKNLIDKKAKLSEKLNYFLNLLDFKQGMKVKKQLSTLETKLNAFKAKIVSGKRLVLSTLEIEEALEDLGHVDAILESKTDLQQLSGLTSKIKLKIIGQDNAVETVSKALIRAKLGLRSRKRPLGNFLFLGPTGVGKTELAKVLAEAVFNDSGFIRLDMSDFGEKHTVARLVGAPPGYVGYGEGGELTAKIEENPNSVVLFDEIEKAHPDVLNILLQIMDEGELSDAKGNRFDFSRSVVILTSNVGSDLVFKKDMGFIETNKPENALEDRLKENLKKIMKPELINRFDEVIVFRKLTQLDQKKVLGLLVTEIEDTVKKQNVIIKVSNDVRKFLIEKGYSEEYGARGLRRAIESQLLDPLAEYLLKNSSRPVKLDMTLDKDKKVTPKPITKK